MSDIRPMEHTVDPKDFRLSLPAQNAAALAVFKAWHEEQLKDGMTERCERTARYVAAALKPFFDARDKWRSMFEAPHDGTPIVVCEESSDGTWRVVPAAYVQLSANQEGWCLLAAADISTASFQHWVRPVCWKPLVALPPPEALGLWRDKAAAYERSRGIPA